jgi:hypothetical protein
MYSTLVGADLANDFQFTTYMVVQFIRISILQATTLSSQIMNEQLALQMELDDKVHKKLMTYKQAKKEESERSKVRIFALSLPIVLGGGP